MKKTYLTIAVLATAGAALAQVNPALPMVTGHGNAMGRPGKLIVTNQTDTKPGDTLVLEKYLVTGSLIPPSRGSLRTGGSGTEPDPVSRQAKTQARCSSGHP